MLVRAIVTGIVQGVNFRWMACQHADAVGVQGTVRNRGNGTVEILAQGSKDQLDEYFEALRKRPGSGEVDEIRKEELEERNFEGFEIVF
jgi:acylphosphatase